MPIWWIATVSVCLIAGLVASLVMVLQGRRPVRAILSYCGATALTAGLLLSFLIWPYKVIAEGAMLSVVPLWMALGRLFSYRYRS